MQKIPTIFLRDFANKGRITEEWNPACLWVRGGEGVATIKWDGTCCRWDGIRLWKRREIKAGQILPADFERAGTDDETGKTVGWVPVGDGPDDQYHREALHRCFGELVRGTYELVGPKIQGNKHYRDEHLLLKHGREQLADCPRTQEELRSYLDKPTCNYEGIVWHHPDGRMAKIKARDFGVEW